MGLGKTLEVLALIESHSLSKTPFNIETSHFDRPISKATLIICPYSIQVQWISELKKHSHLNYIIYDGAGITSLTAAQIQSIDVLFCTYELIAKEFGYSTLDHSRSRRFERKYELKTSLLLEFCFWRVILDEAQMIDGGVSAAAKMCKLIHRQNAWAVTGTPIGKNDLLDLHALINFLDIKPFTDRKTWITFCNHHPSTFELFIRQFLYRNTKNNISEIMLKPQIIHNYFIDFSLIERHCYDQILDEARDPDTPFDAIELQSWILKLRQICCHIQAGSRNDIRDVGKQLKPMEEELEQMVFFRYQLLIILSKVYQKC